MVLQLLIYQLANLQQNLPWRDPFGWGSDDDKVEEVNGRCMELTLLSFNGHLVLQQSLQDSVDKVNMGFWIRGEDQDIIHVDKNQTCLCDHHSPGPESTRSCH